MENSENKRYTKEDIYIALGINPKLIENEETKIALAEMLDCVEGVNLDEINTEEEFKKALEVYKKEIDIKKDGNKVAGISGRTDVDSGKRGIYQSMEIKDDGKLKREVTVVDIIINQEEAFKSTKKDIIKANADFIMKQGKDDELGRTTYKKVIVEPGAFNGEITKRMMEEFNNSRDWDEQIENTSLDWYDAKSLIKYDDENNKLSEDKAKQYRDTLKREYNQYIDESNKLNPEIIKDSSVLRRNILQELGVNEKILEKPQLLAELDGLIDYAAQGQDLQTKEGVKATLQKLRETTEITDTSVSGIKANRKYINKEENSLDVTEGISIKLSNGNMYEVENTKFGKAFKDEKGNIDMRQQSKKTTYRENYYDKTILEETKKEEKNVSKTENIGKELLRLQEGESVSQQYFYLLNNIPENYSELQTLFPNLEYKTTWMDTRSENEKAYEDKKKLEKQNEVEGRV